MSIANSNDELHQFSREGAAILVWRRVDLGNIVTHNRDDVSTPLFHTSPTPTTKMHPRSRGLFSTFTVFLDNRYGIQPSSLIQSQNIWHSHFHSHEPLYMDFLDILKTKAPERLKASGDYYSLRWSGHRNVISSNHSYRYG